MQPLIAPVPSWVAALPLLPLPSTTFPARATRGGGPLAVPCLGSSNLQPSLLGIEHLCVTASQDLECGAGMALEVDVALRMLVCKPIRRYEVRHQDATDLIAILVVLDRIADLTGPEDALRILVCTVEPWIHRHLAELVRRTDADTRVVGKNGSHEDFREGKTIVRQIMVSERASLVAVIEEH